MGSKLPENYMLLKKIVEAGGGPPGLPLDLLVRYLHPLQKVFISGDNLREEEIRGNSFAGENWHLAPNTCGKG